MTRGLYDLHITRKKFWADDVGPAHPMGRKKRVESRWKLKTVLCAGLGRRSSLGSGVFIRDLSNCLVDYFRIFLSAWARCTRRRMAPLTLAHQALIDCSNQNLRKLGNVAKGW